MTTPDLRSFSDSLLDLLAELVPAWRDAIATERQRRADQVAFWSSARAIAPHLRAWQEQRWRLGYSPNEEARGVDEREADEWEGMRRRIRFLRRRALWRLTYRHRHR